MFFSCQLNEFMLFSCQLNVFVFFSCQLNVFMLLSCQLNVFLLFSCQLNVYATELPIVVLVGKLYSEYVVKLVCVCVGKLSV